MLSRTPALLLTALVAASPAVAQTVIGREHTITKTAQPGREVRISGYARTERGCIPGTPPQVALVTPPVHGTVSVRPDQSVVRELRPGSSAECIGMTVSGTGVFYTPTPGFHGQDRFDYTVSSRNGENRDTAVIDVK